MRKATASLLLHIAALSLPTLVVLGFAARFYLVDLPRMTAKERERVAAAAEKAADRLLEDPSEADFTWLRGKGIVKGDDAFADLYPAGMAWKDWRAMAQGSKRTREIWGTRKMEEGLLVWVRDTVPGRDANVVYGKKTEIEEMDLKFFFAVSGGFALAVLLAATFFGIKYFVDYVRARDDFLSATAHDLTTPLAGMRYLIGRDDEGARVLNERMLRLVANIKDFLRLGGRRPKPKKEPFDLLCAYHEAYRLFRDDYRDLFEGEDVAVEMPDGDIPKALGDGTLAVQILWNLLGNDLKYAAPYGKVKAVLRREGGSAVAVDLIDFGNGMSRREMSKAFDRYYRAKTVLVSGKGGFGIGLTAAREFAIAMGGSLKVRANSPKGCIFTLVLPAEG